MNEESGEVIEKYWEPNVRGMIDLNPRRPYHIHHVGVTCEPHLAVARGIRRSLITGRGVPVAPQLRSHKLYATNFPDVVELVDELHLFETSELGPPSLIAYKPPGRGLLVDTEKFSRFDERKDMIPEARFKGELFSPSGSSVKEEREEDVIGNSPLMKLIMDSKL